MRSRTRRRPRWRPDRRALALLVSAFAACLLSLAGPAPKASAQDPGGSLLGDSPMCVDPCESGATWRTYKRSHYGLDEWSDPGITDPGEIINFALHSVARWIWMAALWVIDSILLLLEWAFSLTLTEDAMPELEQGLLDLHENVLGTSWFLAAISIAGLWGIYNGLVRLRMIQTLGGLLATVLLMTAALVIINKPQATIGEFSKLANDSALGILSLGAEGNTSGGEDAYRGTGRRLFGLVVHDPWCALQFASVSFCDKQDNDENIRTDEAWLRWDAMTEGEKSRGEEYKALKERIENKEQGLSQDRVQYMEGAGAVARLGLMILILAGLAGAAALFFYLALQLVIASVMVLLLTMAAPVMLLAPAFGETGRNAFFTWAKRLAGAIFAKLIYALFLAVVVFVAGIIAGLDSLGWGGQWLVLLVFWWGVLIKRSQLLGFVTGEQSGGFGMMRAYFGMRAAKDVAGGAVRGATYLPRKVGGAAWKRRPHPTQSYRRRRQDKREARDTTARERMKAPIRHRAEMHADAERTKAVKQLDLDAKWRAHHASKGRQPAPSGPQPSAAEVQRARAIVGKHGTGGKISLSEADVDRYVKEHGTRQEQAAYARSESPGLKKSEIKRVKRGQNRKRFKTDARRERKRVRTVRRTAEKSRRRDRLYR